jgi:hypothetical protein
MTNELQFLGASKSFMMFEIALANVITVPTLGYENV